MNSPAFITAALAGLLTAGVVRGAAEPAAPLRLTLAECVTMALENATSVANAGRDEQIAEVAISQTRAQIMPQLNIEGSYTRLDKQTSLTFNDTTYTIGSLDTYGTAATLSQLLYNGGQVNAALRAARAYRDYAKCRVDASRSAIVRDTTIAFYSALLAAAAVEVTQSSVAQLEAAVAQAEQRYARQTIAEFDFISSKVRLANERPRLVRARNQLDLARESLRNILKLERSDFILDGALACEPQVPDLQAAQAHALAHRPEIRQLEAMARMREEDVNVTWSEYLPSLNAFATYKGGNNNSSDFMQEGWEWRWLAGLTAKWNIYDGGATRARMRSKKLELEKARANLAELKLLVQLEVRQALLELKYAGEMIKGSAETVTLAAKAMDIAQVRFQQGLVTFLEFNESNLALSGARLNMHQSQHDYLAARARLRHAAGFSNDTFREEP